LINIANLSKLLQSNNPEVVQGIINKIENLSESGGKTFEEVLQEVFSQLNSENLENIEESNLQKATEGYVDPKQKLERLSQNKPQQTHKPQQTPEKGEISKLERSEYSAEPTEKVGQENKAEKISNLTIQPNQKEKTVDKSSMQKIEINIDKNTSKENGATQIVQQLYAQKVYKSNVTTKDMLNDKFNDTNIEIQDESIDNSEHFNQEKSVQDKQKSSNNYATTSGEKTTLTTNTQKSKLEVESNSLDNTADKSGKNSILLEKTKTPQQLELKKESKKLESIKQDKGIVSKNLGNSGNVITNKGKITDNVQKIVPKLETKNTNESAKKVFEAENISEPKGLKEDIRTQGVIKQDKLIDSNNLESIKKEQSTLSKYQNLIVQQERTIEKTSGQKIEVTNTDRNNFKEIGSTQQLQQSQMQKIYKNLITVDDKLDNTKSLNTGRDTRDLSNSEKMTDQIRKTNSTSSKTESTLNNKEMNLQRGNFKDDSAKHTSVKQQDLKNTNIIPNNQLLTKNTVSVSQKSTNPDGIVNNALKVNLPSNINNQIKQNNGTNVNSLNVQRDRKTNINENDTFLEYSKTSIRSTLNNQSKEYNFEKVSVNKDTKSSSNIQQKLDSSSTKTNNYPEKASDNVSDSKVKNTEFNSFEKIAFNFVSNVDKLNSTNTKNDKEKQFSSVVRQDVNSVNL